MNWIFQTRSINTCTKISIMLRVRCCNGNSISMIASENNDGILRNMRTNRWIRWMRAHFGEEAKMQNASTIGDFASDKLMPSVIHSINQLQCGWSLDPIPATSRPSRELLSSAILMSFNQLSIQLTTYWLMLNCVYVHRRMFDRPDKNDKRYWDTIRVNLFVYQMNWLIWDVASENSQLFIAKHVVFSLVWIIFIFVHSFVMTDYRQFETRAS